MKPSVILIFVDYYLYQEKMCGMLTDNMIVEGYIWRLWMLKVAAVVDVLDSGTFDYRDWGGKWMRLLLETLMNGIRNELICVD